MLIDVHTRIWDSPELLGPGAAEVLRRRTREPWNPTDATPDHHHKATGALRFVVIHGLVSEAAGAKLGLDLVARYVGRQPDRFLGSAGIDPLVNGYLEQTDRAAGMGMIGATISPALQNFHPSHSRAMKLYEKLQSRKMVLFVHPASQFSPAAPMAFDQPEHFDEVAAGFPQLRIVIGQLGFPWVEPTLLLLTKHRNVWADLSELIRRPWQLYNALSLAHQLQVTDRLLLGSGFPFFPPHQAVTNLYSINGFSQGSAMPSVPREQLRRIVEHNAVECLGLESAAGAESSSLIPGQFPIEFDEESEVPSPFAERIRRASTDEAKQD